MLEEPPVYCIKCGQELAPKVEHSLNDNYELIYLMCPALASAVVRAKESLLRNELRHTYHFLTTRKSKGKYDAQTGVRL